MVQVVLVLALEMIKYWLNVKSMILLFISCSHCYLGDLITASGIGRCNMIIYSSDDI